jgi:hypothetical protein
VYEVLIQEIRATKAQHKLVAKTVEQLQRNVTSLLSAMAAVQAEGGAGVDQRLGALLDDRLSQVGREVAAVQRAVRGAAIKEHAALLLMAAMTAVQLLNSPRLSEYAGEARKAVAVLAVANGLVGVLLIVYRSI